MQLGRIDEICELDERPIRDRPTITPVVQNVTRIAAGVHLDFTNRYSRKLVMEAPPTAATASMMEMGIAVPTKEDLKTLANEPRSVLTH